MKKFLSFRVFELPDGSFERKIVERSVSDLPPGEVLIRVHYSGLNYKDALSAWGNKGVTRRYPHTPGIDAAGVVEETSGKYFKPGDKVIISGFDLGMNTDGGFGQYIRVPEKWIIPLPPGFSLRNSMIIGGSGFTAAQSVLEIVESGLKPTDGPILVTGAAGGVGSWCVVLLKKLGYYVIAGTSRLDDSAEFIRLLGADEHVDKSVIDDTSGRALKKWLWAGAIDNVGGNVLATALKCCKYGGTVTACGNIYSHELHTTVYPFILNAIRLIGISSQETPMPRREKILRLLAEEWKVEKPPIVKEIGLKDLEDALAVFARKKNRGQVLLNLN